MFTRTCTPLTAQAVVTTPRAGGVLGAARELGRDRHVIKPSFDRFGMSFENLAVWPTNVAQTQISEYPTSEANPRM